MRATSTPARRAACGTLQCLAGVVLSLFMSAVIAATPSPSAEIQARYTQDRSKCLSGQSNQDQPACLKEAGAARDLAMHGQLDDGDVKYRKNARVRCDTLSGDEARDCVARMKGAGTTSGSVEAGGIYRETVTREVKPVDAAASAASAP